MPILIDDEFALQEMVAHAHERASSNIGNVSLEANGTVGGTIAAHHTYNVCENEDNEDEDEDDDNDNDNDEDDVDEENDQDDHEDQDEEEEDEEEEEEEDEDDDENENKNENSPSNNEGDVNGSHPEQYQNLQGAFPQMNSQTILSRLVEQSNENANSSSDTVLLNDTFQEQYQNLQNACSQIDSRTALSRLHQQSNVLLNIGVGSNNDQGGNYLASMRTAAGFQVNGEKSALNNATNIDYIDPTSMQLAQMPIARNAPAETDTEETTPAEGVDELPQLSTPKPVHTEWTHRFRELMDFEASNFHCRIPSYYLENPELGKWVQRVRDHYIYKLIHPQNEELKKVFSKILSDAHIELLNSLGFAWTFYTCNEKIKPPENSSFEWKTKFLQLLSYKKLHGDVLVDNISPFHFELRQWTEKQIELFEIKQCGMAISNPAEALSNEEFQALRDVGVSTEMEWDLSFEKLKEYKDSFGNCSPPCLDTSASTPSNYDNAVLGKWVKRQRDKYKAMQKGGCVPFSSNQMEKLRSINFIFVRSMSWNERYEMMKDHAEKHGNCLITQSHKLLGSWVKEMRKAYVRFREGKPSVLDDEKIKKLNDIGFVWRVRGKKEFEEKMAPLTNPTSPVVDLTVATTSSTTTSNAVEEKDVNDDSDKQSATNRTVKPKAKGRQSQQLCWETRFEMLLNYKQQHGNCLVPQTDKALGPWVKTQRKLYEYRKNGEQNYLTQDRVEKLNAIGFIWRVRGKRGLGQSNFSPGLEKRKRQSL